MRKGFILFAILAVFVLAAVAAFFVFRDGSVDVSNIVRVQSEDQIPSVSPIPFPFAQMTIPHLRSRDYKSEIVDTKQTSSSSNYITYFAAYDSDGFRVNGMLTRPVGEMPEGGWPAVVFIHGYIPPTQYQTMVNYNSYVDYLTTNGFVVFKIDLRGHAQSEGEPSGAYYSGDYVVDALNAKAALESTDFVKRGAVGLWGHSMAGNVVFRSFVASGDVPAVVIWAGAVYTYEDWEYGINDNSYRPPDDDSERARKRRELFNTHGEFDKNSDFWKTVPATNYLDGVEGAVQVHHAANDNVVTVDYSRNLMSVLDGTGVAHELFEYSDGGHNLTGSTFNLAMQRTVDFFKENLN